jgi:hypothetical protein
MTSHDAASVNSQPLINGDGMVDYTEFCRQLGDQTWNMMNAKKEVNIKHSTSGRGGG